MFSGIDNGLAVMTKTAGMDLNKYKYHLSLHNRFSPLGTLDDDDGNVSDSTGVTASAAANDGNPLHQFVATVHTTNEHKTSQTCMYCFGPISHPTQTIKAKDGKTKTKSIHEFFLCLNPDCVSVINNRAIQDRDTTSALAIAASGLSDFLFKQPLSVFNPTLALFPRPPLSAIVNSGAVLAKA